MNKLIDLLERQQLVWRGHDKRPNSDLNGSGYSVLDEKLDGGFPKRGVVRINSPMGIGELRLLLPTLLSDQRLKVFINPIGVISAEFLYHQGFDLNNVLILYVRNQNDALWSAEQCLKSGACHSVLLWQNRVDAQQAKRLQLACETGQSLQFLMHSTLGNRFALPVTLEMNLSPHQTGIEIDISKRKGGWPLQSFTLDMTKQWPALALVKASNNVIFFPGSRTAGC